MSGGPFFSVIIPVYNVEKYLHQCVDSVLVQTYEDFEIILVDDGSPDNCPAICDGYREKDSRVKVVHKKNGGLSEARNFGIDASQGKYLLFLDSDDYWDDPQALAKIKDVLDEGERTADIVIFQAKLLYPDGSLQADRGMFSERFNSMEPEESLRYLSENGLLIGSACSKVVRRDFLVKNRLYFKVGIKSEDIDWILRTANCLPKYLYSDQFFYIYRKGRSDSITSNVDSRYLSSFADMLEEFMDYEYTNEMVRECLLGYVAYEFTILMAKTANLRGSAEKKALHRRIRGMDSVLNYSIHPKVKKIGLVKKLMGFDGTMFLLGLYLKYRNR